MGREIRRVPADWEHPTRKCPHSPWAGGCSHALANDGQCYQPLHSRSFKEAAQEWKDGLLAWERGERPDYCSEKSKSLEYWEYSGGPPDREYYRPEWTSEPTHYQVYETVSEGTPVTPHFATKEELINYLVEFGDEWDQSRAREGRQASTGWPRKNAEDFVEREWTPSAVVDDGVVKMPRDGI